LSCRAGGKAPFAAPGEFFRGWMSAVERNVGERRDERLIARIALDNKAAHEIAARPGLKNADKLQSGRSASNGAARAQKIQERRPAVSWKRELTLQTQNQCRSGHLFSLSTDALRKFRFQ